MEQYRASLVISKSGALGSAFLGKWMSGVAKRTSSCRERLKVPRLAFGTDRGTITFVDFADAAAHNEEVFRSINERIEEGAKQHGVEQLLPFHCECATEA